MSDLSNSSYSSEEAVACSLIKPYDSTSSSDEPAGSYSVRLSNTLLSQEDIDDIKDTLRHGISKQKGKIYPRMWYKFVSSKYTNLAENVTTVARDRNGWVFGNNTLLGQLEAIQTRRPKNLVCDICIISASRPLIVLTVMNNMAKISSMLEYNTKLARVLIKIANSAGVMNFDVVNGIVGMTTCEQSSVFQAELFKLESASVKITLPSFLAMDDTRYKSVISTLLCMVSGSARMSEGDKEPKTKDAAVQTVPHGYSAELCCDDAMSNLDDLKRQSDATKGEEKVDIHEFKKMKQTLSKLQKDMKVLKWGLMDRSDEYQSSDTGFESYETAVESLSDTSEDTSDAVPLDRTQSQRRPFDRNIKTVRRETSHVQRIPRNKKDVTTCRSSSPGTTITSGYSESSDEQTETLHEAEDAVDKEENVDVREFREIRQKAPQLQKDMKLLKSRLTGLSSDSAFRHLDQLPRSKKGIPKHTSTKAGRYNIRCDPKPVIGTGEKHIHNRALSAHSLSIHKTNRSSVSSGAAAVEVNGNKEGLPDGKEHWSATTHVLSAVSSTEKDRTLLHGACFDGKMKLVKEILSSATQDINIRDQLGRTPIMLAALNANWEVFDFLKNEGADLSVVNDEKDTILNVACYNDNVEFVKYLLTLNITDINVRGQRGRTPVMQAAINGCRKVFHLLVSKGVDLLVRDESKNTILNVACLSDNVEFVKHLLTLNIADINVRGFKGRTPLMQAANKACRNVFDLLVNEGADLLVLDESKNTILNVACYRDNVEFVKFLLTLQHTTDINVRGFKGRTPILQAANKGCRKVFDLLVSVGADLSVRDDDNNTILNIACLRDNVEFVKYLLTLKTFHINIKGELGWTPIMQAAGNGCRKVFDLLRNAEADLKVVDYNNDTLLNIACFRDNVMFVGYLLTLKIFDINVIGELGWSPVMQAAGHGCRKVFDLLVREGADLSLVADDNCNILHMACVGGSVEIVKYLISHGTVDISSRTSTGLTAVQIARKCDNNKVVETLTKSGCH